VSDKNFWVKVQTVAASNIPDSGSLSTQKTL